MIRPYHQKDQAQLIQLLRLNTPQYFAPSEEEDFIDYLQNIAEHYFVMEEAGQVIACGGFNCFEAEATARISWDIVHPDSQGKGLGKALTLFRINEIKKQPNIQHIVVRTSQLAFQFYQKLGFTLEKTEKNYWAKGFDLYHMTMEVK